LAAAAFFDLDRTVIRRSSVLALAGSFRRVGLISRTDLVKSVFWQVLFVLRGASAERVRSAAEDGMKILDGFSVEDMRRLVGGAMEPVLRPLVYDEPLHLLRRHRDRGERVYIVSATLQEIVEHIAFDLGFDGAIGSTCEIVDGIFTGVSLRPCYGGHKADAVRELARRDGLDLESSTGYSDSASDLAFLEAIGEPVAINPDRRLRHVAEERHWPILRFEKLFSPLPA